MMKTFLWNEIGVVETGADREERGEERRRSLRLSSAFSGLFVLFFLCCFCQWHALFP
jgi:hypothetical protein